jgi:hypothetical protein
MPNQQTQSHNTYIRMVCRQHTSPKSKCLLSQHKSILVPPKFTVRGGKIAHCGTWNRTRQRHTLNQQPQSKNRITPISEWFSGNTRCKNSSVFSSNTRASWCRPSAQYVAERSHIVAPETERVNVTRQINNNNRITPIFGWFSGHTLREIFTQASKITTASSFRPCCSNNLASV